MTAPRFGVDYGSRLRSGPDEGPVMRSGEGGAVPVAPETDACSRVAMRSGEADGLARVTLRSGSEPVAVTPQVVAHGVSMRSGADNPPPSVSLRSGGADAPQPMPVLDPLAHLRAQVAALTERVAALEASRK